MLTIDAIAALAQEHKAKLDSRVREFSIGDRPFLFNTRPAIMGVVNLSPDSWYRESVCLSSEAAIDRARILTAQGADLIDIGAESSLAQASRVDEATQSARLVPVIKELCKQGILVSVETYQAEVAAACLKAGAQVINMTGHEGSETFFRQAAEHDAAVILCYVEGKNVREVGDFDFSRDPIEKMLEFFARQIELAGRAGVEKIVIDPGLGFYYRNLQDSAQRVRFQMKTFLNSFRLRALGFPVCNALPHAFEYFREEVRCAEPFFAVLAALGKTDLFRTHEVAKTKAVLDTLSQFAP